jgi:hypothetical protein
VKAVAKDTAKEIIAAFGGKADARRSCSRHRTDERVTHEIQTRHLVTIAASPALAASKNPFSSDFWHLDNTDLIVLIAFIIFMAC